MIADYKINCGPKLGKLRVYSVTHLRAQNALRWLGPEELLEAIGHKDAPKCRVSKALTERLRHFDARSEDDIELIEKLILKGHSRDIASSPHAALHADLFWQAAALLTDQYDVEHVNDIPRA